MLGAIVFLQLGLVLAFLPPCFLASLYIAPRIG